MPCLPFIINHYHHNSFLEKLPLVRVKMSTVSRKNRYKRALMLAALRSNFPGVSSEPCDAHTSAPQFTPERRSKLRRRSRERLAALAQAGGVEYIRAGR